MNEKSLCKLCAQITYNANINTTVPCKISNNYSDKQLQKEECTQDQKHNEVSCPNLIAAFHWLHINTSLIDSRILNIVHK